MAHLAKTPIQHQGINFDGGTLNPTPTARLIGAPTVKVPKIPSPIKPYLFQIVCTSPVLGRSFFGFRYLAINILILSPKNAATNTPAIPPTKLAKNMVHGLSPKAKPAGMAA